MALQAVIDRHDILRTAILWDSLTEPVQVVVRKASLPVEEITLHAADAAEQFYASFNPRQYRMDVRRAPMLRLFIAYDKQNQRWLMIQLLHHLVDDEISIRLLREEIQTHLLGREKELPAAQPFRNLVAQARLGTSQQEHESFFQKMLGEIDGFTAPFDLQDMQDDCSMIQESLAVAGCRSCPEHTSQCPQAGSKRRQSFPSGMGTSSGPCYRARRCCVRHRSVRAHAERTRFGPYHGVVNQHSADKNYDWDARN